MSEIKKPQYQKIIDDILNDIQTEALKPGDKIPTDHELMKLYGVSRITVTRAINELVQRRFVYRVKKRGSFICESQDEELMTKGATPFGRLPIISVVLPFDESFGYDILRGVEMMCQEKGFYMTFHISGGEAAKEREILQRLEQDGVSGIIVYPQSGSQNIGTFSQMLIRNVPYVFIDRQVEGIDVTSILTDNLMGMHEVTKHLIDLGHQKIAFIGLDSADAGSVKERYKGYCQALIEAGIALRSEYIVDVRRVKQENYGTERPNLAAQLLRELTSMPEPPTALAAVNDVTAVQFIKAASMLGISVPDELSITGFDNLSFSEHLDVPLTTVEQQFVEFGRLAASLLIDEQWRPNGAAMIQRLSTKLIVRKSTAKPKQDMS